ncbi:L-threonylcarbamoyladenylate synthase [Paenibacillus methanolicus]|uniref:Threonylcarbamoyl-AMP synthase n=1 Tax=Paenibacillus methanolicus TaxID=582686 RepID=A0A5S5CBB5_9BACL|nr:L-threonylcarbamoyladenylate synthase [Paenibacillus methanolicus]TYP75636.1 L-threonylcarbamoyladenylate synthase [Paenibacillus methanolicus]
MNRTIEWRVDARAPKPEELAEAAGLLREGDTVAFPTETVYGLGADARSDEAVARIFEAKGRPSDNPLIVHIADRAQLAGLALPWGELAERLMDRFWPGPLTLVLPAAPGAVSSRVTAGLDTVAVRMPSHPVALALIAASGCPVAAPSANRSGRPSPTLAAHVAADLGGRIAGIVDGGAAGVGLESTVVEIDGETVRILRPGGVTAEELREVVPRVEYDAVAAPGAGMGTATAAGDSRAADSERLAASPGDDVPVRSGSAAASSQGLRPTSFSADPVVHPATVAAQPPGLSADAALAPRSPGMKYAHYAPRGVMELVQGDAEARRAYIRREAHAARARGERAGILTFDERAGGYDADDVLSLGSLARLETAAQSLYAALREFDDRGTQRIWAESVPETGIGHALMNRLVKAAGHRVVRV